MTCAEAMDALQAGRWSDWPGLTAACTLPALDALFGGSTVLDAQAALGSARAASTRSSMNEAPLIAWHLGDELLLVELDLASKPLRAPAVAGESVQRLDVNWGTAFLRGGEWVMPERGLALIVTDRDKAVSALGFAPTTLEDYVATLRPARSTTVRPLPRRSAP